MYSDVYFLYLIIKAYVHKALNNIYTSFGNLLKTCNTTNTKTSTFVADPDVLRQMVVRQVG
mgnify:FL=1